MMELVCCEMVLMNEIAQPECTLEGLAKTLAMAWVSSENENKLIDWAKVTAAITARWGSREADRLQGMVRELLGQESCKQSERN